MAGGVDEVRARLAAYDPSVDAEGIARCEDQRAEVLKRFPRDAWASMSLERYAVGQESSEDTFCYWMEWGAPDLGSIRGGSARKMIVYKRKSQPGWYFPPGYEDEQRAWEAVRAGFVTALERAANGDWEEIDTIQALRPGQALLVKTLHTYFPDEVLPIYSRDHLRHFLSLLDRPEARMGDVGAVRLNRALLASFRELPEARDLSTKQIERFVYRAFHPMRAIRVVRISPGPDARFWEDCRTGGYICVGWDEMGDLREFDSKETFEERFLALYLPKYGGNRSAATKKAHELWTLMELEPGDLVVATRGTSRVLAVGTVVEPGYRWSPERPEHRHTVVVEWDDAYAQEVPSQQSWAQADVQPLRRKVKELVLAGAPPPGPGPEPEPPFAEIGAGLEWKGQVILYGPPGTGKTYAARRFAVWWLLKDRAPEQASRALEDPAEFDRAERRLSTTQVERRVWWVVANPKQWNWDRLFQDGSVEYRYGRIQRNYALVQPGDLVVGYQGTPDKRIVALARVSRGLETAEDGKRSIELVPLARVDQGPTWDELIADRIMASSEPMRNRNQGTLFALSSEQATHILSLLAEREPAVEGHLDAAGEGGGIGPLTRLTFHPSYSYEDFIEGFRPVQAAGEALSVQLVDGVFKRVCLEAQARPDERFLVLIDEINRANVAKVLGETITLLEKDKRGMVVTLPQSKEPFTIPPNVFLLGTMNTADRSIKLLDVALRRRFAFVELMPDTSIASPLYGQRVGGILALDVFLDGLNAEIAKREGREKQIGHSFFLRDEGTAVTDPDEFARAFRQEVLPLLQEYCYEDYGTLAEYLGDEIVDRDAKAINDDVVGDPERLIGALEARFGKGGPAV